MLSCLDVAFPTAGIGTELLADREKNEVTRRGSPFERSPVPMARAHRPTRGLFGVLSELDPEIGTGWRSGVDSNSRFRLFSAKTANFRVFHSPHGNPRKAEVGRPYDCGVAVTLCDRIHVHRRTFLVERHHFKIIPQAP
jgi:hypothetical protein